MVYSRATTSLMAERDFLGAAVFLGWVEGLSLAIATVLYCVQKRESQFLVILAEVVCRDTAAAQFGGREKGKIGNVRNALITYVSTELRKEKRRSIVDDLLELIEED